MPDHVGGSTYNALMDLAARRRYRIMYGPQTWDEGSDQGHAEALEAMRPVDVAAVAAALLDANAGVVETLRQAVHGPTPTEEKQP